jgi:hypothetical protein
MLRFLLRLIFGAKKKKEKKKFSWAGPVLAILVLIGLLDGGKQAVTKITHHGSHFSYSVPDGSAYTPTSWAKALLKAGGWSQDSCNVNAIKGWESAEGGNWENSAHYNPLDTTQREPGSYSMNSVNVQAYVSWTQGFQATLTTLGYSAYGNIRSALAAGDSAQRVAEAVASSPWGTGPYAVIC